MCLLPLVSHAFSLASLWQIIELRKQLQAICLFKKRVQRRVCVMQKQVWGHAQIAPGRQSWQSWSHHRTCLKHDRFFAQRLC